MTSSGAAPGYFPRSNNLALAFQEAFTVILRTRYQTQRVENAESFRAVMRKMISSAVKECGAMGYSDEVSKMAIYAIIGFLDENVLSARDPVFADWAKKPLQEEMFGSQVAGEYFFRNVADLVNRPNSAEVADVLELHALCLLLGYRGRFVTGDATEIHTILRRIRDKITSIRGEAELFRRMDAPPAPVISQHDPWVRKLTVVALVSIVLTLAVYLGYLLLLAQSTPTATHSDRGSSPRLIALPDSDRQEKLA